MKNPSNNPLFKIGEAAKALGVHIDTLRRWEKAGKITPVKTSGGTRFYSADELNKVRPGSVNINPDSITKPESQNSGISDHSDFSGTPSFSGFSEKSSLLNKFLIGTAVTSVGTLAVTGALVARSMFFTPKPQTINYKPSTIDQNILAATTSSKYLEFNTDALINGTLNNLSLEATPSAGTISLTSGTTTLDVSKSAKLDQDVSTLSTPTFVSLSLGSNKINVSGAAFSLVGLDTKNTLKNKTLSGSDNTFTSIPNSALSNAKVTVTAGTNLSGGGDVNLGSSVTLSLKDSPSISGTLTVTGATTLTSSSLSVAGVAYTFPTSDGSSNSALTTNGSGTLAWSSLSSAAGWTDDGTVVRLQTITDHC